MPSQTVTALLECSGNGRVFLEPPQVSIRWELGAVSTAEWKGVPLAAVLERAGVKPNAVEVILEGSDRGEFKAPDPKTPGVIPYARSLPLAKAKAPEVLLAYEMNGEPLPPRHGHPVRAVVAGWYGMASVKWLKRVDRHRPPLRRLLPDVHVFDLGSACGVAHARARERHPGEVPGRPPGPLRGRAEGDEVPDARGGVGRASRT